MINAYASESHYVDHVAAVWNTLGNRGVFLQHDLRWALKNKPNRGSRDWWMVASAQDASMLRGIDKRTKIIFIEHGVGQTYLHSKDPACIGPGRARLADVFWMPNQRAASIQKAFTGKPVHVMYPHRADELTRIRTYERMHHNKPIVVFSFHHDQPGCPEQQATYHEWLPIIEELKDMAVDIYGHAHPREQRLFQEWQKIGIPIIEKFDDVIRRADVYICDNSSTIYEAADAGIPVVVLNGYRYRPAYKHGLRFYQYADVGLIVSMRNNDPAAALRDAITRNIHDHPQRDRAAEICGKLFDRTAPTADELSKLLDYVVKEVCMSELYARATRDIVNPKTGVVKAGQIFRPGFHHTQWQGQAVAGNQTHPKPEAALALMVSNRMAIRVDAPAVQQHVETPAPDNVQSNDTPIRRRQHGNPDSNPRPIHPDLAGSEGSPSPVDGPLPDTAPKKTGRRKSRSGPVLPEPLS